jgi:hypothetical protein
LTFRSYRLVSWWTSTAATVSGLVLPVAVFVASILSPGLRLAMGAVLPPGSRTGVLGVKLMPPRTGRASSPVGPFPAPWVAVVPLPVAELDAADGVDHAADGVGGPAVVVVLDEGLVTLSAPGGLGCLISG